MSTWETFLLGGIAGSTIFLGLPMARVRGLRLGVRAAMTAIATGILIFLLWDVLSGGVEPVEASLQARHWGTFALRAALLAGGFALGLMSLVYYDWWLKCRRQSPMIGYAWVSEALQVLFFALAAGSILYVVMELVNVCRRFSMPITVTWMILVGITLVFATDWILVAAGA